MVYERERAPLQETVKHTLERLGLNPTMPWMNEVSYDPLDPDMVLSVLNTLLEDIDSSTKGVVQ